MHFINEMLRGTMTTQRVVVLDEVHKLLNAVSYFKPDEFLGLQLTSGENGCDGTYTGSGAPSVCCISTGEARARRNYSVWRRAI